MKCSGLDALTGCPLFIQFSERIERACSGEIGSGVPVPVVSPGFIDIQVNGFDGVDFNNPSTPPEDINRSLRAMLGTGVTLCLPTVITGGPEEMLACLRNLRRAQVDLPLGRMIAGFH